VKAKEMRTFGKRKTLELHPDSVNRRLLVQGKKPMTQQQWNKQNEIFKNFQKQYEAWSGHNAIVGASEKTPSFSNLKAKIKTWGTEFKTGFKKTVTPKPKPKPFEPIPSDKAMVEWAPPKGVEYPIGRVPLESGARIGQVPDVWIGRQSLIAQRGLAPAGLKPQTTLERFGIQRAGYRVTTLAKGKPVTPSWEEVQVMRSQARGRFPTGEEVTVAKPRMRGFTTLEKYGFDVGLQARTLPKGEIILEPRQPYRTVEGGGLGVSRPSTYAEAQLGKVKTPTVAKVGEHKAVQVAERLSGKGVSRQISLRRWETVKPTVPRAPLERPVIT